MPLEPLTINEEYRATPLGVPEDFSVNPDAPEQVDPSLAETTVAAFRQSNPVVSLFSDETSFVPRQVDPEFNLFNELAGTEYEDQIEMFSGVYNAQMLEATKRQIEKERQDRKTVQDAGWWGTGLSFGAAIASPENLIPGSLAYRTGKMGYAAFGSAARVGASAMGATVLSETALQSSQRLRTFEESLYAVGGAGIVGFTLGGALAKLGNASMKSKLASQIDLMARTDADLAKLKDPALVDPAESLYDDFVGAIAKGGSQPGDAGAASVKVPTLDELSVYGKAAGKVHEATKWLNPIRRLADSPSPTARQLAQELFETSTYIKMNDYAPSPTAVETLVKRYTEGTVPAIVRQVQHGKDSIYMRMRKAGINMPIDEFNRRVSHALRNKDADLENPFVEEAAQVWRSQLYEPMRHELNSIGYKLESSESRTSDTYLYRVWNPRALIAQETKFKGITKEWLRERVAQQLEIGERKASKHIENAQRQIDDLEITKFRRREELRQQTSINQTDLDSLELMEGQLQALDSIGELADMIPDDIQKLINALTEETGLPVAELAGKLKSDYTALYERLNAQFEQTNPAATADSVISTLGRILKEEPPKAPETLTAFLKRKGGIVDTDKRLETAGIKNERLVKKSFKSEKTPEGGMSLEEAARVAWEDGFFEGRPDLDEVIDALQMEASGRIRATVRKADEEALTAFENYTALKEELKKLGIENEIPADVAIIQKIYKALDASADARIAKAKARLEKHRAKLDEQIKSPYRQGADSFDKAEFESYLDDITDGIFNKLTGRGDLPPGFDFPVADRGPLKERTFGIPDNMVYDFIEHDAEMIGRRYARVVGAQVEMKKRFGSQDLADHFQKVNDDYARQNLLLDLNTELSQAEKEKLKLQWEAQRKDNLRDLEFARDKILGRYKHDVEVTKYSRVVDAALTFNFTRSLGGVLLASVPDIWRTTMVHGLGRAFGKSGWAGLVKGLEGVKMNKQLARKYAGIAETINNSRMATLAEISDPYAAGTPFERVLQNMGSAFSKMTGLPYWNQFNKELASSVTMDRILSNAAKGMNKLDDAERRYMNFLGLGDEQVAKLQDHIANGDIRQIDGVWSVERPGAFDGNLSRSFWGGVAKDMNSIIVTKSYGDVPVFANTPTGRMLMQFKSFAFAGHQRVLMRGLQEDRAAFISGLMGMVVTGAFSYVLKQLEAGRKISNNPGTHIAEGLDRSGAFSLFFELNNTVEKLGGPGLFQAASAMFPDKDQRQSASRFSSRSVIGSLAGPTFGGLEDIAGILGVPLNAFNPISDRKTDLQSSDVKRVRRLVPFAGLPYWRWYIDNEIVPYFEEEVD